MPPTNHLTGYLGLERTWKIKINLMDPWNNNSSLDHVSLPDKDQRFEDNFKPDPDHLPDSEQYLAILESKLERIKKDPNVLKQFSDKREACMQQLLAGRQFYDEELRLEAPINNSALVRTITPQRAALNQGEIVELVRYDQLINQSDDENEKHLT